MRSNSLRLTVVIALLGGVTSCTTAKRQDSRAGEADVGMTEVHPLADPESRATAERERLRREQALRDATQLVEEGDRMRSQGDNEAAIQAYQKSLDQLPQR